MKSWIVVASKDHIQSAVEGGFIQAGHGKRSAIKRFSKGDELICYSPKLQYNEKEPCQHFTAFGVIADSEIYQLEANAEFLPYRRKVIYQRITEAPIRPLIEKLSFIQNKKSWGYPFRFGVFAIPDGDAEIIKQALKILCGFR